MKSRLKILIIVFGIIVIGALLLAIKINSNPSSIAINNKPSANIESKIYTVKEAVNLLTTNPSFLKNKSIQLEAYVVSSVGGIGCSDYQVLTDKEWVDAFKNMYNEKLTQEEQTKAINESKKAPTLLTGRILSQPEGFFPTYHAIYQGHFYDKWATTTCPPDGNKRFTIEKKVREIVSDKQSAYQEKTISTGLVIANGKYIQSPYTVTLKDNKVTINGVLYEPSTQAEVGQITEFTDQQRQQRWQSLTTDLGRGTLIIYGGNRYEWSVSSYPVTIISDIDTLMKSSKSGKQKREELAKLLNTFPENTTLDDILKNWK